MCGDGSSVVRSCLTLCDLLDSSLPSSSVRGISEARIMDWVAFPSPGKAPYICEGSQQFFLSELGQGVCEPSAHPDCEFPEESKCHGGNRIPSLVKQLCLERKSFSFNLVFVSLSQQDGATLGSKTDIVKKVMFL